MALLPVRGFIPNGVSPSSMTDCLFALQSNPLVCQGVFLYFLHLKAFSVIAMVIPIINKRGNHPGASRHPSIEGNNPAHLRAQYILGNHLPVRHSRVIAICKTGNPDCSPDGLREAEPINADQKSEISRLIAPSEARYSAAADYPCHSS
jgi:hypothetical protein